MTICSFIADDLKTGREVAPQAFDCVSMGAFEIVDLCQITSMSKPAELICIINDLWATIDEVLLRYDVFKVCRDVKMILRTIFPD
jgi:hypothetical protein